MHWNLLFQVSIWVRILTDKEKEARIDESVIEISTLSGKSLYLATLSGFYLHASVLPDFIPIKYKLISGQTRQTSLKNGSFSITTLSEFYLY